MELLNSRLDKAAMAVAIAEWNALDLEEAAAERAMIGSMVRTPQEWYAHPQGELLAAHPAD